MPTSTTAQPVPQGTKVALLGDARSGKLGDNLTAFGRALRRAGVPVDASRMALALAALQCVGVACRPDVAAALESVFVSREQDQAVFRELFDAFFRDPELARQLLARMLPDAAGRRESARERPRVREALSPPRQRPLAAATAADIDQDAAMTASALERLKAADFNQLTAGEFALVERLVREIPLPVPTIASRRPAAGLRGGRLHWGRTLHAAAQSAGDVQVLHHWQRRRQPLPLLMLVDVSGSMERYARTLLAFLHVATSRVSIGGRRVPIRRDVFAFGTELTDLGPAFRLGDTDAMLGRAGELIRDFAGGTRLGTCLASLRHGHARCLVGRRTLVLIVSDGLDCDEPEILERELVWLKRHVRSILWLNPLLRFTGYEPSARGAAVLHRSADGMLAVHNVTRLRELAGAIAALMKSH